MKITNVIDSQSFDSLSVGEFFTPIADTKVCVKVGHMKFRELNGDYLGTSDLTWQNVNELVHPLVLSTCRYRNTKMVKVY